MYFNFKKKQRRFEILKLIYYKTAFYFRHCYQLFKK